MLGEILLLGYLPMLIFKKIKRITIKTYFSLKKIHMMFNIILMRWILFISLHLLVFLIIILSYAEAKEEWTVTRIEDYSYASVSGEIQYGDKFAFILMPEDNCNKITTMFSFYTWNDPGDYRQLLDKHIPIKLNDIETTAEVIQIIPVYDGLKVIFTLGVYPIKEYTYMIHTLYNHHKKYEIEIIDGINFKANKYFDITINRWKLEKFIPSIKKAINICRESPNINT